MFRYRLRTLLLLTILGPPVLAGAWFGGQKVERHYRRIEFDKRIDREAFVPIWQGFIDVPGAAPEPKSP